MWRFVLLLTLCLVQIAVGYKILVVFPFASRSHGILGEGVVRHLVNAGHEVHYITPYPKKDNKIPNLHYLDVSENEKLLDNNDSYVLKYLNKEVQSLDFQTFFGMMKNLSRSSVNTPDVKRLLNNPKQEFDLVLMEWMFMETNIGFAAVFDCPFIWLSSNEPHWMVLSLIDEMPNPAYNADMMSTSLTPLNFVERVKELATFSIGYALKSLIFAPAEKQAYEDCFTEPARLRGRTLPPYSELKYQGSLILGNAHVSMGEATRLPQNYKSIGGYHIDSNIKPLPENLKEIMDNAKNGVIYFSMGSNIKAKDFPDVLKQSLVKMFGTLKQTVLWKFEEKLPNLPKNVHVLEWAPQPSILAHPNCLLFITHGGLLSTTETIHYGKPIIGMPVFSDQFINVGRAVKKGFARKVDFSYEMADDLKMAVDEMLSDERYAKKAKELSLIYHDRPVSPGKELVHWVEHVIKTNGAPHLRSPALSVPWYQKLYLDLLSLVLLVLYILYAMVKYACCKRKNVNINKKTN